MKNSVRYPHLLKTLLLHDLTDEQKNLFLDQCAVRFHEEPTTVLSQGSPSHGLILIAHGAIEVSYVSSEGNRSIIHHAGVGETLGEVEAISDNPCAANCRTLPNTTLLFCATPLLFDHLKLPVFVRNLTNIFYHRLVRDNQFKSVDQFFSVEQRICSYLSKLSAQKTLITQSQSYLANVVGCSRQTMNRTLGSLRDAGIIALRKGSIEVLNRDALNERINLHEQHSAASEE